MKRKNLLFVLCILFSITGWLVTVVMDDGLLFHNLYLQPMAGAFLFFAVRGREKKLPFLLGASLSIPVGVLLMTVFMESVMDLYLPLVLGIPCVILLFLGCGIMALILYAAGKRLPAPKALRMAAGAAAFLLLIVLFVPLRMAFGDPITAMIHKGYLDGWMTEYLDTSVYAVDGFHYNSYDGIYYYRLTEKESGAAARLSYFKTTNTIYFDGTDCEYPNTYH